MLFSKFSRYIILIVFAAGSILLQSCASTKIQSVDVYTAPYRSPVKIVEHQQKGSLDLQAQFSYNKNTLFKQNIGGHTNVNANRDYIVEEVPGESYYLERKGANPFNYQWENLIVNVPQYQGMIDIEYCLTKSAMIYGGLNFSTINDEIFLGKKIGLAFYSTSKNTAIRFSGDVRFQETQFDAQYLKIDDWISGSDVRKVYFYSRKEKKDFGNINFGIGFNTKNQDFLVNFFIGFNFGWQTFFEFSDFSETESYTSLLYGIYKTIPGQGRLIFGGRYTKLASQNSNVYRSDFYIQYDFSIL